jgi:hypothetical protein
MIKKSPLSFQAWKTLFRDSFIAFPALWWRIATINVLMILMIVFASAILLGIGYFVFRDSIEDILLNMQFGGAFSHVGLMIVLGIVWIFFLFFFSLVGKIANWITVRNNQKKKTKNPFNIYFTETWKYFWRYVGVGLKMLWYVLWPIFIVICIAGIVSHFVPEFPLLVWGFILSGLLFIWRIVEVFLAPILLIHYDKTTKKSLETSIALVRGNWWRVFLFVGVFFLILKSSGFIFSIFDFVQSFGWDFSRAHFTDYMSSNPQIYRPSYWTIVNGLYSFFILTPFFMVFPYRLMLKLTQSKKLKP